MLNVIYIYSLNKILFLNVYVLILFNFSCFMKYDSLEHFTQKLPLLNYYCYYFSFQLFVDKDTIINAVSSSHDVHLLKIDNREDELITRINGWMTDFIEETHQKEEISRNRARVTEINNLIDHLRDELDNLDLQTAPY